MKLAYLKDLKKLTDSIAAKINGQFIGKSNLDSAVSAHNTSSTSHEDIRSLISALTNRLNALADSDDETLDQLSEIVAYIKSNKDLIESVTTSKVSVSDIIDSLDSAATDKPLSAKQGEVLKSLISDLSNTVTTGYATVAAVEDLKKSVSDGKTLVADAITEKGVETAADSTFATMAENISQIETGSKIKLQAKTVSPSAELQKITADSGYDGLDYVVIGSAALESKTVIPSASNQVITPGNLPDGRKYYGLSQVTVNAVQTQEKTITPTTSQQIVTPDSGKFLSQVTVNAIKLQSKTIAPTTSAQIVKPDSGYNGLSQVTVGAQQSSTPTSVTLVGKTVVKCTTLSNHTATKSFSLTFDVPFSGSKSTGTATLTMNFTTGEIGKHTFTAATTITGISFDAAASVSMIAEHMGVDLETAQQMYDTKDVTFEVEEDELETSKVQKISETITKSKKLVVQDEKLVSGVHDAAISNLGEAVSGLAEEGGQQ